MTVEQGVRFMAGTFVLVGLALYYWVSPHGLWLVLFVGLNLVQSAFTGLCPAESILRKLGFRGCGN
jgi:hypothetical protein